MVKKIGLIRGRKHSREQKKIPVMQLVITSAFMLLLIALFIAVLSRKSTVGMLRQSEESLVSSVYANITSLERAYEEMSYPGADVKNVILPQMRVDLNAAVTVNQILVDVYGVEQAVLSEDMFGQIADSITYMESMIDMGKSLTDARHQMELCMQQVQVAMMERFPDDTSMVPVTT